MSEIVDLTNESGPVVPVEAAVVHRPRNPYSAAAAYTRGHSSATSVVQGLAVSTSTTVVSFSLVSLGEFTARIDQGPVNREILDTLKEVRGRFDADNRRWVFPCDQHDKLRVALTERHRVSVKPLPRSALVASQVLGQTEFVGPTSTNAQSYYQYDGSFTTAPCTENVVWVVLKNPLAVTVEDLALITQYLGQPSRPVQPLNERIVFSRDVAAAL